MPTSAGTRMRRKLCQVAFLRAGRRRGRESGIVERRRIDAQQPHETHQIGGRRLALDIDGAAGRLGQRRGPQRIGQARAMAVVRRGAARLQLEIATPDGAKSRRSPGGTERDRPGQNGE